MDVCVCVKFFIILWNGKRANTLCIAYRFQSYRFVILENFGCFPGYFPSYFVFAILFIPPLLLSLATLVYGCA